MRRICLALILPVLSLILSAGPALAQEPDLPLWQAAYWNNETLSGPPVLQRTTNVIDYNWGAESPDPEVADDHFSARWVGDIEFEPATYRFTAESDDGIRVWVDGDLIIDGWYDHPLETFTGDKNLSAGHHHIVVEYYEDTGGAIARLWWAPAPPDESNNWRGEYYNNRFLQGEPVVIRQDPQINFNWGTVPPALGVERDTFSVRWTRNLALPAGSYRFEITVDDGARLWVNGRLVIDAWQVQSTDTYSAEVYVPGGQTPVKMEYFDNERAAVARLTWERASVRTESWRGAYFANPNLTGAPAFTEEDEAINFNWGRMSPAPQWLGVDRFSVRWTRALDLPAGVYRFRMVVDDGGRLWVGDKLVIDAWQIQAAQVYTGQVVLSGRVVGARMEYFENTGQAVAQLSWQQLGALPQASFERERANQAGETAPVDQNPIIEGYEDYFDSAGPSGQWREFLEENYQLLERDAQQ